MSFLYCAEQWIDIFNDVLKMPFSYTKKLDFLIFVTIFFLTFKYGKKINKDKNIFILF